MDNKTYLYDAFGELIYLIAMTDGGVQTEERAALERILGNHSWAKEIIWSFDYEASKNNNLEDVYKKVISACHHNGPDPEFQFMVEVMEAVAAASKGKEAAEEEQINGFVKDLTERFKRDIEKLYPSEED
jgi:tellurite resistance protein